MTDAWAWLAIAASARCMYAAIALWSFLMATAHGAGLMLLPALGPLCLAGAPAREITASGALVPASRTHAWTAALALTGALLLAHP